MKPFHKHDCADCILTGQLVEASGARWDFYFCEKPSGSAIARYGPDSEYLSVPTKIVKVPLISMAEVAAQLVPDAGKLAAGPTCEVCQKPVREGLRFCAGLSECFLR